MQCLDLARDKILMGTERRSMIMSDAEKLNTAYPRSWAYNSWNFGFRIRSYLQSNNYSSWACFGVTMYLCLK